jgi:hypothetical protein
MSRLRIQHPQQLLRKTDGHGAYSIGLAIPGNISCSNKKTGIFVPCGQGKLAFTAISRMGIFHQENSVFLIRNQWLIYQAKI